MQRHLGAKGLKIATRTHDYRCDDHQCAVLDQECNNARDPEMHQTKKGNQWYYVMKVHFGVYSPTKLIHAVVQIG